jgi:hypothetical protein
LQQESIPLDCLDSELSLRKVRVFLLLLDSFLGGLRRSQSSANGSGLLLSEFNWGEFLALVLFSQLGFDGLVVDSQHASDWFADNTNFRQLRSSTSGDFGNTKLEITKYDEGRSASRWHLGEFAFQFIQLLL